MAARYVTLPLERAECVAKFSLEILSNIAIAFSSVLAAGHGSMGRAVRFVCCSSLLPRVPLGFRQGRLWVA